MLYAALAARDDAETVARCRSALKLIDDGNSHSNVLRTIAGALLESDDEVDTRAIHELLSLSLQNDDDVALAALACRRVGGAAWERFRAEVMPALGQAPLSGQVVVLVNRLTKPGLPLVTAGP